MYYHIIDGNYQVNRAVYADKEDLSIIDPDSGEKIHTGGAYYFLRMVNMIKGDLGTIKNRNIVVVFDGNRHCKRRKSLYEDYKKRTYKELTEEQKEQKALVEKKKAITFSILKELLPALGITIIDREDIEADDLIYALTRNNEHSYKVYSDDEDYLQMLDKHVKVHRLIKQETFTEDYFRETYNFHHSFLPLFKSLQGDPSDSIKGVPGIGKKRAQALVEQLQEMREKFDDTFDLNELKELVKHEKAKWAQKLVEGFSIIERNLQLIDLRHISEEIHTFAQDAWQSREDESSLVAAREMLKYYDFKSLYSMVVELM